MKFGSLQDSLDMTNEMPWSARDVPTTVYEMLAGTAAKFPDRPAISYQLMSGATDKAETLSWSQFHDQVCQAANLFRSLGVGEGDVVALVLPNATETAVALMGGMTAGIVNPINPLLEPEQIGAILRETKAKVVVTLRNFPKTDVAQKTAEAVKHAPSVHTILTVDLNRYLTPPKSWIVPLVRPKMNVNHHADVKSFNAEMAKQPKTLSFKAERFWLLCHLCVEAFYIRVVIDVHLRTHKGDDPALWRREVAVEIHREDCMHTGRMLDRLCRFLCDVCFGEVAQGHHDFGFGLAQNCADLLRLKQWVDRIDDTCSHAAHQGNGCFCGVWKDKRDNIAFPYTKTAEEIGGLTDLIMKLAPAQCLSLICCARHQLITYCRTIRKLCRRPCEHFINRGWHITCAPRHFIGHV